MTTQMGGSISSAAPSNSPGGAADLNHLDAGMYGSRTHSAGELLYEVASWLHDVAVGDSDFEDMHASLDERLVPAADAALAEVRALRAEVAALNAETRARCEQIRAVLDRK